MNEQLKQEILEMADEDRRVRAELVATGELFDGYNPRMAEVHRRNGERLQAIVREFGWPGKSLVGDDGAEAAWLVLQHAIGNPQLQRECLPLLRESAQVGESEPYQVAFLEDRIAVFEGRPQRYGTQFDWDENGELSPLPLLDPKGVDRHRASVGLGPLAERMEQARRRAKEERDTPPADFEKRRREQLAWAKSVGWR
jgi:hypothetical protein